MLHSFPPEEWSSSWVVFQSMWIWWRWMMNTLHCTLQQPMTTWTLFDYLLLWYVHIYRDIQLFYRAVLHWLCIDHLSVTTGHLLPSPLQNTCNLNAKNLVQTTSLRLAVEREHSRIVEVLVGYGADVNMACSDGHTPLHVVTTNKDMKKPTLQTQQLQRVRMKEGAWKPSTRNMLV